MAQPDVGDHLGGRVVQRDARLPAGGALPPAAGRPDQLGDGAPSVADDLGGTADRGGDHLAVDHDDPEVVALDELLDQHVGAEQQGVGDGALETGVVADPHRDAAALLAPGRLDHHLADLPQQAGRRGQVALGGGRPAGDPHPARCMIRRVTRLSSQRLIATAVVSSDSDSRVSTVRPPTDSRISPNSGSVTSTRIPRRSASSAMIRA